MVFDRLDCAEQYYGLGAAIARGLRFLRETDLDALPTGRQEIDGERLYAQVNERDTTPLADNLWEAHRRYIDIQYLHRGVELVGHAPLSRLTAGPYDAALDYVPASGDGAFLRMQAGDFAIFWPGDAHMPATALGAPAPVRRIVVKVAVGTAG
jgi:YhcH/YjgK/YiaL family protein